MSAAPIYREHRRRKELVSYAYVRRRIEAIIAEHDPALVGAMDGKRTLALRLADKWTTTRGFPAPYYGPTQRAELAHDELLYDRKRVDYWIERFGESAIIGRTGYTGAYRKRHGLQ